MLSFSGWAARNFYNSRLVEHQSPLGDPDGLSHIEGDIEKGSARSPAHEIYAA
jgi:hypothetical protein